MSSKRRRRGLSEDDREVWQKVAKTVEKTAQETFGDLIGQDNGPTDTAADYERVPRFAFKPRQEPAISVDLVPAPAEALRAAPRQMDRKNFDRLRKGKMVPDRKIDLHGMTADVAHAVLVRVLLSAHSDGARLVLVVTGKGRGSADHEGFAPERRGVLRRALPEWLRQAPLADKVVQVLPAHRRHGGDGAFYVYLRRKR